MSDLQYLLEGLNTRLEANIERLRTENDRLRETLTDLRSYRGNTTPIPDLFELGREAYLDSLEESDDGS